jgi:cytidylate kinase
MVKINVAIDGFSGVGKSTVGKLLAQHLGYNFLDSGLLYRHFAQFCQKHNFSSVQFDRQQLNQLLLDWQKLIEVNPLKTISQLEKERECLAAPEISAGASKLATLSELRQITLHFQQKLTQNKG